MSKAFKVGSGRSIYRSSIIVDLLVKKNGSPPAIPEILHLLINYSFMSVAFSPVADCDESPINSICVPSILILPDSIGIAYPSFE